MEQGNIAEQNQSVSSMPETAPAISEKMVPQSQVDSLAGKIRHEAYQKGLNDAKLQTPSNINSNTNSSGNFGGMPSFTPDQVKEIVRSELSTVHQALYAEQQKAAGEQLSQKFSANLNLGKEKYSDFDEVTKNFPYHSFPNTVLGILPFDNMSDMAYELSKDPDKFSRLERLIEIDAQNAKNGINTNLGAMEIKKLSESIKSNQKASSIKTANPPLNRQQPSPLGTDNGSSSVSDLRKRFRNF